MNKTDCINHIPWLQVGLLGLAAIILTTLFSACSWLYPLNPWDDANVFMTIGQALQRGSKLYVDIFDHKGPLLYLLHQWSAAWFERPFLGIYFLQIISLWIYLFYAWRTTGLFGHSQWSIPFVMLLGLGYMTSDFYYYGDTAEELGLPWIMLTLYYLLRYVKTQVSPSVITSLVIGLGAGYLFWIKFTLLTPYAGALVAMFIICYQRKDLATFWRTIGYASAGFLALSAVIIIYYTALGEMTDMLDGYFGFNLFRYHGPVGKKSSGSQLYPLRLLAWFALVMIPLLHRRVRKDVRMLVTLSFATTMILFAITTVYIYYFIICFAFFPLLFYYVRRIPEKKANWSIVAAVAILMTITDFNLVQLCRGTFPNSILTITEELCRQEGGAPRVLTYRSRETGYYSYAHVAPPNRFFFLTSMVHEDLKQDQDQWLRSRECPYVIVKDQVLEPEVYDAIPENGYELIETHTELFRTLKLLNPKLYLWNLGWTQAIMLPLTGELEAQEAKFRLYKRNIEK